MADFDAKSGDYAMALDWLAVAEQHRILTTEYQGKKDAWKTTLEGCAGGRVLESRPPRRCCTTP